MSRWNFTARNSCRNRAGVSPQTRTSIAVQREQDRLGERDVVAVAAGARRSMSSNEMTRCSSFRSANRLRSICSGVSVSDSSSATSRDHRGAVERLRALRGFGPVQRGGLEHRFAQLVRRVVGRDLELAAVFEQLREPRGQSARGPSGMRSVEVVGDLAAGAAGRDCGTRAAVAPRARASAPSVHTQVASSTACYGRAAPAPSSRSASLLPFDSEAVTIPPPPPPVVGHAVRCAIRASRVPARRGRHRLQPRRAADPVRPLLQVPRAGRGAEEESAARLARDHAKKDTTRSSPASRPTACSSPESRTKDDKERMPPADTGRIIGEDLTRVFES